MTASVQAGAYLHHPQLHSDDPARMARFYADAMDMQATKTGPGAWMCEGPARQVMFSGGTPRALGYAGFAVRDPDGNWIEISAELEVMHDRPVKEWRHEPQTLNSWGRAIMRVPA